MGKNRINHSNGQPTLVNGNSHPLPIEEASEGGQRIRGYKERFRDYKFEIEKITPFDPEDDEVEVRLRTRGGIEYSTSFVTLKFLTKMFEKNARTGECASGAYFAMPCMVVVKRITDDVVKATIDDMIENLEIEQYFKEID